MLTLIPEVGAPYTVENGRITSHEDGSIMRNIPFRWITPPVVGQPAEFRLTHSDGTLTTKPIAAIFQGEMWNDRILNDPHYVRPVASDGRHLASV